MNPHQKPQEDVVVTQEDREAAAQVYSNFRDDIRTSLLNLFRRSRSDRYR